MIGAIAGVIASKDDGCTIIGPNIDTYVGTIINASYGGSINYGLGMYAGIGFINSSPYPVRTVHSSNGQTWSVVNPGVNAEYRISKFGGDRFVAVAGNSATSNRNAVSTDGVNWTHYTNMPSSSYWYGLGYGNGQFIAGQYANGTIAKSVNGITWTSQVTSMAGVDALAYGGTTWVAAYRNVSTVYISVNNGLTWAPAGSGINSAIGAGFSNNIFFVTSISGAIIRYSTDFGVTWPTLTMPISGSWRPPVWLGSIWVTVVVNAGIATVYWSPDLINWTAKTPALSGDGNGLASAPNNSGNLALYGGRTVNNFIVSC